VFAYEREREREKRGWKGMKLKVEQQKHKIFQKLPHKYEQSKTTADKKSIYLILHIN
jgi:hypothetical protein